MFQKQWITDRSAGGIRVQGHGKRATPGLARGAAALAIAGLALAGVASCNSGESHPVVPTPGERITLTAEEQAYLKDLGTLQVGSFNNYAPFSFLDESGEPVGIAADYWELVADQLGVTVEYFPSPISEQIASLRSGDLDTLQGIFVLPEREEWFAFTAPYLTIQNRIYVDKQRVTASTLEDLKAQGLVVAVVAADSSLMNANEAGLETLVVPGYEEAVDALAAGDAQAMILGELVAEYYIAAKDLGGRLGAVGEPVYEGAMGLPVQKDDTILLGILNKAVAALDGAGENLKADWLGR